MKTWALQTKHSLDQLSRALLAIHKILMDDLMEEVQRDREQVFVSGEKLNLLLVDPEFQWLRPLSTLIADIDDVASQKEPITKTQTDTLLNTLDRLLFQESSERLYIRVHALFDQSPDLVVHYGHIKRLLSLKGA